LKKLKRDTTSTSFDKTFIFNFVTMEATPTPADPKISNCVKLGYGTGHVLNDMSGSMWFAYLLLFFNRVLGFSNSVGGIMMVVGHVSDGIFTLFVGYYQDWGKDCWLCQRYHKRKGWHLIGTVCIIASFPFIFMPCVGCNRAPHGDQIIYYCAFVIVFQFGWACVHISHLALIPDLTSCEMERTMLTSYRYAAKILSNLLVYFCMLAFLGPLNEDGEDPISQKNAGAFRDVAFICVAVGSITSLAFHVAVRFEAAIERNTLELASRNTSSPILIKSSGPRQDNIAPKDSSCQKSITGERLSSPTVVTISEKSRHEPMKISNWLREPRFWKVCLLYVCARMFINLSQAYTTLYLEVTLELPAVNIGIIPLVMFLAGLITSATMSTFTRTLGRRGAFVISCLLGLIACLWVSFGNYNDWQYRTREIYIVAVLFGAGGSALLITSIAATADLIGNNVECSASVYGLTSLAEKFACGLAFGIIQELVPNTNEDERDYYRDILVYVCGASVILALVIIFTMGKSKFLIRE